MLWEFDFVPSCTLHNQMLHQGLRPYLCDWKTQNCLVWRKQTTWFIQKLQSITKVSIVLFLNLLLFTLYICIRYNSVSILSSINRKQMWLFSTFWCNRSFWWLVIFNKYCVQPYGKPYAETFPEHIPSLWSPVIR